MSYSTSGPVETILRKEDTVDPVAGNDNTQGYAIKSRWINTSSNEEWVCTDASTGAALWELTTAAGDLTSDGTTAQDAAFFTERPDHVNTFPDPGNAELWVENTANQSLQFTDDAGTDYDVCRTISNTALGRIVYGSGNQGELFTTAQITFETSTGLNLKSGNSLHIAEDDVPQATSAGYGRFWVRNDAPTTPMFTDDDATIKTLLNKDITLASNELVDIDATEVVIGGAYLDGSTGGTFTWEILGTYNDNGGTGVQDLDVYLYDRGPDGTPVAGVLRSIISIDTLDTLDRVTQTLTASGTPGVDTDTIFNTGRLYEVRAKLDAGGGVDTAKILSVRFIES